MRPVFPAALGAALLAACGDPPGPRVPLYQDLGTYEVPISTRVPRAQAYFNQGMRLTWAFNHGEAVRAFAEAARLDPACAICHWGVAFALGPNINVPMDSAAAEQAFAAIARAGALADRASDRERALIEALSTRYAAPGTGSRAALDSAWVRAMAAVVNRFPDDLEAATLLADGVMNLSPWNYWDGPGRPRAGTEVVVTQLERVIAKDPGHPGACHLYIHAMEAVEPARALPCAERLAALMPGAGHLVHMPAHIYIRVGRYDDAIAHNQHATHADSTFAALERPSPVYATVYMPHNWHFLGFAGTMAGRAEVALPAARETAARVPLEAAQAYPELAQPLVAFHHLTLLKFGRWDDLLALPVPAADLVLARALVEYARGTALAATGDAAGAAALLDSVRIRAAAAPEGLVRNIVLVAQHSLEGELAARRGAWPEAANHFRAARGLEDDLGYMEPPWWVEPVRHALGNALLRGGRAVAAEAAFREDLDRFPRNCWSLVGLWQSLAAQRHPGAGAAEAEFRTACASADVEIPAAHL
jgi:tetratricopeptide (TPR) repeat protein